MDAILKPLAWAAGVLAFGAADLFAVGAAIDQTDLLLLGLGAAPIVAFALLGLRPRSLHDN